MAARHRIFIAVPLDPALAGAVVELERRITAAGGPARWIRVEQLHFTVRFLGEITPVQVALVRRATRTVAAAASPFPLTLQGIGAFPSLHRPQVIWVGVREGAEGLARLSRALDDALAPHHFPREDRPYVAHLTLTRVRDRRQWGDVVRALSAFRETPVGTQVADRLAVMESHLGRGGARYTVVEEVPLGHLLKSSREEALDVVDPGQWRHPEKLGGPAD